MGRFPFGIGGRRIIERIKMCSEFLIFHELKNIGPRVTKEPNTMALPDPLLKRPWRETSSTASMR